MTRFYLLDPVTKKTRLEPDVESCGSARRLKKLLSKNNGALNGFYIHPFNSVRRHIPRLVRNFRATQKGLQLTDK